MAGTKRSKIKKNDQVVIIAGRDKGRRGRVLEVAPTKGKIKIEGAKAALANAGLDIFVNARTDVYLAALVEPAQRVDDVLSRAKLYEAAGADGLFVPVVVALNDMRQIAAGTTLPLNVLSWHGLPAPVELEAAGVRRLSAGSGIAGRVWAAPMAKRAAYRSKSPTRRSTFSATGPCVICSGRWDAAAQGCTTPGT